MKNTFNRLEALIDEYKNERSWLEKMTLFLTSICKGPKYSCTTILGNNITIYPYIPKNIDLNKPIYYSATNTI